MPLFFCLFPDMDLRMTSARKTKDSLSTEAYDSGVSQGLSIISIAKSYDHRQVLEDVSLNVGRGEVVGLLGPTGQVKRPVFIRSWDWSNRMQAEYYSTAMILLACRCIAVLFWD